MPLISVLMPVYNGERFIAESIRAVLDQTCGDFELIIINDGSTDHTRAIVETFQDARIRIVNTEHIGLTKALNVGLREARGEFIARNDADDVSVAERFALQLAVLKKNPDISLIGSSMVLIDADGVAAKTYVFPSGHLELVGWLEAGVNPLPHSSIMVRMSVLLGIGGYNELFKRSQDVDMYLRLAESNLGLLASLPSPLCKIRYSTSSLTQGDVEQRKYGLFAAMCAELRRMGDLRTNDAVAERRLLEAFDKWYSRSGQDRLARAGQWRRGALIALQTGKLREFGRLARQALWADPYFLVRQKIKRNNWRREMIDWWHDTQRLRTG